MSFSQFVQDAPARDEKDDVVTVLDDGFGMVSHNGFAGSGRGTTAAMWQPSGHLMPLMRLPMMAEVFLSPCATTSMASAVPRRMGVDGNDVAAPGCGRVSSRW
ncbi:Uncharacterised protein [Neisseria gonorrhoeae]|nr:Uncharacterised protein [Neisseria gonorrhoeae]